MVGERERARLALDARGVVRAAVRAGPGHERLESETTAWDTVVGPYRLGHHGADRPEPLEDLQGHLRVARGGRPDEHVPPHVRGPQRLLDRVGVAFRELVEGQPLVDGGGGHLTLVPDRAQQQTGPGASREQAAPDQVRVEERAREVSQVQLTVGRGKGGQQQDGTFGPARGRGAPVVLRVQRRQVLPPEREEGQRPVLGGVVQGVHAQRRNADRVARRHAHTLAVRGDHALTVQDHPGLDIVVVVRGRRLAGPKGDPSYVDREFGLLCPARPSASDEVRPGEFVDSAWDGLDVHRVVRGCPAVRRARTGPLLLS